jgi:hypothetical protein
MDWVRGSSPIKYTPSLRWLKPTAIIFYLTTINFIGFAFPTFIKYNPGGSTDTSIFVKTGLRPVSTDTIHSPKILYSSIPCRDSIFGTSTVMYSVAGLG